MFDTVIVISFFVALVAIPCLSVGYACKRASRRPMYGRIGAISLALVVFGILVIGTVMTVAERQAFFFFASVGCDGYALACWSADLIFGNAYWLSPVLSAMLSYSALWLTVKKRPNVISTPAV